MASLGRAEASAWPRPTAVAEAGQAGLAKRSDARFLEPLFPTEQEPSCADAHTNQGCPEQYQGPGISHDKSCRRRSDRRSQRYYAKDQNRDTKHLLPW